VSLERSLCECLCEPDQSTIAHWANRFCDGRVSIADDTRSGRLKTATTEENVKVVADALQEDCHMTLMELSEATGLSAASVHQILREDLKKRKICSGWVPHALSDEEKQKRLDAATLLKQRFVAEGMDFLHRIIAIDETWLRDFEPELKAQSNKCPQSPRHKNFRHLIKNQANDDCYL